MSSAVALRISYIAFGLGVLATVFWIATQVLKLPVAHDILLPIQMVGMTWPLSLYAVAMYRRKLGAK